MPHRQGKMPQTVIHPARAAGGRLPAETPQSVPLLWVLPTVLLLLVLALALLRRARRTPLQTVQAEFCALHRKMRRCGLAAEVSSEEAAFAEFLQTHCPQTDRETVQHLLDAVQAAQFAPDPCTAETAQEIQTLCRKLRKNCADERCEGCARGSFTQEIIDDSAKTIMIKVNTYRR